MFSRYPRPEAGDLVDKQAGLLLNAISRTGPPAVEAFRAWRSTVSLDDAGYGSHRVMPMIADLVRREGIDDPDLARMRGVGRHIWVSNVLKLRLLFAALDALEGEGVCPILLKGAALFAQTAGTEGTRASADYDVLVLPTQLKRAGEVLEHRGFHPEGHVWSDLIDQLVDSVTAGIGIALKGHAGAIDLHWRPLWNIHDPALAELFMAGAEERTLRGHAVRVPSVTHHLFSAMARCEPWDRTESFTRLVEGHILLSGKHAAVDWNELALLVERYGLNAPALAYCAVLIRDTDFSPPPSFIDRLAARLSARQRREWRIRARPPEQRTPREQWHLNRQDIAFHRADPTQRAPGRLETGLRSLGGGRSVAGFIWRLASRRVSGTSTTSPRFLEGFSYPEAGGRWTLGKWALMTVPLTEPERQGEVVCLNAHVFRGNKHASRVVATGGHGLYRRRLKGIHADLRISLRVRSLRALGGDGLLLLWLPDACTPRSSGQSADRRELGLFVRKDWCGKAPSPRGP